MREPISLSPDEFFLLWWAADLGEPPTLLDVPHVGYTPTQRARHAERASARLAARGLGTVSAPHPDLERLLQIIANASTTIDLRGEGVNGTHRVLGAPDRTTAAVAVRTEDQVVLGRVDRAHLVAEILGVLTPLPAGPGGPANVPRDDLDRACEAGEQAGVSGFLHVLRTSGVRATDASTLARAFGSREGGGQLGVTRRGTDGRRTRGASPVTWLDTPTGRYALRERDSWVTATPAAVSRLVSMANDLIFSGVERQSCWV